MSSNHQFPRVTRFLASIASFGGTCKPATLAIIAASIEKTPGTNTLEHWWADRPEHFEKFLAGETFDNDSDFPDHIEEITKAVTQECAGALASSAKAAGHPNIRKAITDLCAMDKNTLRPSTVDRLIDTIPGEHVCILELGLDAISPEHYAALVGPTEDNMPEDINQEIVESFLGLAKATVLATKFDQMQAVLGELQKVL